MRDVEMPVGSVCNVNVPVWPVGIGNVVDLHAGRKHVHDNSIIQRYHTCTDLFAPNKLGVRRIHGEEITFHSNEIAFVTLHRADKMTLRVILEELPMNDVNVFANINDHKLIDFCFAFPNLCLAFPCSCPRSQFLETPPLKLSIKLGNKNGKIDMNLATSLDPAGRRRD